jgi:hypothetical protein
MPGDLRQVSVVDPSGAEMTDIGVAATAWCRRTTGTMDDRRTHEVAERFGDNLRRVRRGPLMFRQASLAGIYGEP